MQLLEIKIPEGITPTASGLWKRMHRKHLKQLLVNKT